MTPERPEISRRGMLVILSSPSGAGKSTLSRRLLADDPQISFSVSATTRPPRAGEVEGREYFFRERPEFERMVAEGEMLEHAEVFGNLYGTPIGPVRRSCAQGSDVLFDVDWQGGQQIRNSEMGRDAISIFIMKPVLEEVNEVALQPYMQEELSSLEAVEQASQPFRKFMLAQTRESDLGLFMRIADEEYDTAEDVSFWVLLPAFVTSELKTAFQIGFILFIPFLIIDMVVASVLMAMGMMMLSPIIISLPFKIMLFVLVDGWALIMGTLAASYVI
jgi:flagellar biosynthetic protein FliP